MKQALEALLRQGVEALGYELIELRQGGTSRRPLLEVRIDRIDGAKVSVDDCALVSRAVEPGLDASGLVGSQYVLEVSSPGAERLLRHAADWRRFVGRRVRVKSSTGFVEGENVGVEGEGDDEVAVVRDSSGTEQRVALAAIKEARLVLVWK